MPERGLGVGGQGGFGGGGTEGDLFKPVEGLGGGTDADAGELEAMQKEGELGGRAQALGDL